MITSRRDAKYCKAGTRARNYERNYLIWESPKFGKKGLDKMSRDRGDLAIINQFRNNATGVVHRIVSLYQKSIPRKTEGKRFQGYNF